MWTFKLQTFKDANVHPIPAKSQNLCHRCQTWVKLQLALCLLLLMTLQLCHLPPPLPPLVGNSSCLFTPCQPLCTSCCTLSSVQSLSRVWLCATPWTVAHQASLSITNSWGLPKLMSIGDAIQPSHPLSSPSPPTFSLSQNQGLFQWVSSSNQVAKGLEFQLHHQSFQWTFRTDFL